MARQVLPHLRPESYEHPADRKALTSLEKMPGIAGLFKKVNEYGIDRLLRFQCIASDIRVNAYNFSDLYAAFTEACKILSIHPLPELYLIRGTGHIQTFTYGVEHSIVMINLQGLEELTPDEWVYLIGHELAHIKSQHMLYYQSAIVLPTLKQILSATTLGIGGLATTGVEFALFNWLMMAKFTADRAGLLTCQDLDTAISSLVKVAGLPKKYVNKTVLEQFKQQAIEFEINGENKLDKVAKSIGFMEHTYPWAVIRAAELLKWVNSGSYEALLSGSHAIAPSDDFEFADSEWFDDESPNDETLDDELLNAESIEDESLEPETFDVELPDESKESNDSSHWNFLTSW